MFMWHLNQLICTYYFKYPSSTGNRIRSIPQNMKWKAIRTYTIDKKFKKKKEREMQLPHGPRSTSANPWYA